ncbi:hypothetical protein D3C78_1979620 [compost metagenome]
MVFGVRISKPTRPTIALDDVSDLRLILGDTVSPEWLVQTVRNSCLDGIVHEDRMA